MYNKATSVIIFLTISFSILIKRNILMWITDIKKRFYLQVDDALDWLIKYPVIFSKPVPCIRSMHFCSLCTFDISFKTTKKKEKKNRYSSKIAFLSWLWDLKNILHSLLALTMSTFVYLTSSRKRRKMQGHLLY